MSNVDMIVDLQFGSTGKGLIAGYLAMNNQYDTVMSANMPNAGHTFIDGQGQKMIHKVLPNGVVSPACDWALIGPGAVFDPERLLIEVSVLRDLGYEHFKVGIHPNATILQEEHAAEERKEGARIGSTMQGSGAAMAQRIERDPEAAVTASQILREQLGPRVHVLTHDAYRHIVGSAKKILAEGAQGFSLGISEQFYPYCTSRDCTPARFLADMGIPVPMLKRVIGTARVHPIRVGGTSGPGYEDQEEISWQDIGVEPELTTVTQKVRRVFTYSRKQMEDAVWAMRPDSVFLNFCNYDQREAVNVYRHIESLGVPVGYSGHGPGLFDVIEHWRGS